MLSHVQHFCGSMNCSPPDSCVHEILQARILEWVAVHFSRGSSQPGDRTHISCTAGLLCTLWIVVQLMSCVWLCNSMLQHARLPCPSLISYSLLTLKSIESMILSNRLILCCHLFLLPSVFPSISVFPSELAFHIRWPKYWSSSFSINHSNECSVLSSFSIDWFGHPAVQATLKSLLQHHNLKALIFRHSAFMVV